MTGRMQPSSAVLPGSTSTALTSAQKIPRSSRACSHIPRMLQLDPNDQVQQVLKRVLAGAPSSAVPHGRRRPLLRYIVTVADGGLKVTDEKDPTAASECHSATDKSDPAQYNITCISETMAQFIGARDQDFPASHLRSHRPYQTIRLLAEALAGAGCTYPGRPRVYTEAFARQLGLSVTRGDVLQPAFVVDTVDRTPTANSPDIATLLPVLPDLEFEAATIKTVRGQRAAGYDSPRRLPDYLPGFQHAGSPNPRFRAAHGINATMRCQSFRKRGTRSWSNCRRILLLAR